MQWLTVIVWVIVAGVALPLGRGAVYGRPSLGVQAMAALSGLALTIAICAGGSFKLAWWAFAAGVLGVFAVSMAAASLTAEHETGDSAMFMRNEEHEAGLAGAQLILLATATILTLLVALDIGVAS